ncbi:unnamed protein product [marine sediment metagenome]|uniref:Uncharacterized protein n=1 Tax=marine sediment metagenome TaxID=412755 RepID=X1CVH5_9ZZZZ
MFNKQNLEKIFEGKEFGYGKDFLYLYAVSNNMEYETEEETVDVKILDGIVEITVWTTDDENHLSTGETESIDYVPFENIHRISFGKDY